MAVTVLENEYNGLNWRVKRRMDLSQGAYDGLDEERTYYYTASWQVAEERIDTDFEVSSQEELVDLRSQQFWGVRYIDDAVAKRQDRNGDGSWTTATLDNWYYLTDVMFSVRGIADRAGNMHTRVDYTPYGVAMHRYAVDIDGDGQIDSDDVDAFVAAYNGGSPLEPGDAGYDPDADLNADGLSQTFVSGEYAPFIGRYNAYSSGGSNPSPNTGWIDVPGDANGPDNSVGYDGYWFDVAGATDAGSTGLYSVRHRTYGPGMGRWLERDIATWIDGMNLYLMVRASPASLVDPFGRFGIRIPPRMIAPALNPPPGWPSCVPWDPEIAMQYLRMLAACPNAKITYKCANISTEGDTYPQRNCRIEIRSKNNGRTPKRTMIHEMEHAITACTTYGLCDSGRRYRDFSREWNENKNLICNELRSYCTATPSLCTKNGRPKHGGLIHGQCQDACNSVTGSPTETSPEHINCVAMCKQIWKDCHNGKWDPFGEGACRSFRQQPASQP